ncbi:CAP domain-containing protein [Halobacillus naozhouensis]|uniref:CAP domain-containing protein n=1 Tax=Halobacillus naozhouensis TaxID=554880 RepID=A0ABY8J2A0_9BACI|nr:CAP domain-containing protein [Halobacillus naozhouensis]WFT76622.1 CAP domain-containing protein [Halobacillus naozhouensis]
MRNSIAIGLLFILLSGACYLFIAQPATPETQPSESIIETASPEQPVTKNSQENLEKEKTFFSWLGTSSEEILSQFKEPDRIDQSPYGYEWWVYSGADRYFQFGIRDGEVVTAVTFSENPNAQLTIGKSYRQLNQAYTFQSDVSIRNGMYSFQLTEKDIKERPLIPLNDEWSAQLYFDTFTKELSAVRAVRNDILLEQQPYQLTYRGDLPTPEVLTEEDWEEINQGAEQQIFEMSNYIRLKHGIDSLVVHDKAAAVAFSHSKDMNEHNYFSHHSQNGDGVGERLRKAEVPYTRAGENIAAQHIDATAAIHGWLNSKGHRESLLDERYTHLGVGVDQLYYTQNFLALP